MRFTLREMELLSGLEPETSSLPWMRSTTELPGQQYRVIVSETDILGYSFNR